MSKLLQIWVRLPDGSGAAVVPRGPDGVPADAELVVTGVTRTGSRRELAVETRPRGDGTPVERVRVPIQTLGECNEGERVLVELEGGWIDAEVLAELPTTCRSPR